MPPRKINPQLLRLLQGMPSFQGLPQTPQQIQAPAPIEQPNLQAQLQAPAQGADPNAEQKAILTNKLKQQYANLLSEKIPSDSDNPYTRTGKLFKKGGIGGILGGLVSAAATPLGAGIIGMMMNPYEGAGLYQGAAAGEALRVQRNKGLTGQRQKKLAEIREYLKSQGGGDIQEAIDKARGIEQAKQDVAAGARIEPTAEDIPEGYQFSGFGAQGRRLYKPILSTPEEKRKNKELDLIQAQNIKAFYAKTLDQRVTDERAIATAQSEARGKVSKRLQREEAARKIEGIKPFINTFKQILDELPVSTGLGGIVQGALQFGMAKAKLSPKAAGYLAAREGLIAQLAKALGNVGTLSDLDIKRAEGLLPNLTDPQDVRDQKFKNLFRLLDTLQKAKTASPEDMLTLTKDIRRLMGVEIEEETGSPEIQNVTGIQYRRS